ncbi:MAG TPA: RidA family protein [Rhizobiaceae bacterium]
MKRESISPERPHALFKAHGYSPAIKSGDLLFVSGMVGARPDGSPEPDYKKQVELAFEHLRETLKGAGADFDDIVDVTMFMTDPESQIGTVLEVRDRVFSQDPPHNITALGVNWLAGFDFEIKVIARIPS